MKQYIEGDIHDVIKTLDDNSVDFIYTDPPFSTTEAKWDQPLRWEELFPEMWRVLKPTGIICLYSALPFTYELYKYEKPKYHYSWKKNNSTGFFQAKYQPLRCMEEINIYYKKRGTYNPQMEGTTFYPKRYNKQQDEQQHYGRRTNITESYTSKTEGHIGKYPQLCKEWKVRKDSSGITRTDDQIDYFIKTYSNEDDTILDMTCHNGYVGERCELLKRHYIGIDLCLT
jgi:DNA modification methylase